MMSSAPDSTIDWRLPGLTAMAALALLLALYRETLWSMVDVWSRSDTFAHGFLIFPISGYLIWRRRHALARLSPHPDYRALVVIALLGLAWLLAHVADVLVIQQVSLIGMIPALVWALLGWRVTKAIAFPLGFLLFSVPFGEFLIPPMMDFTADFTVAMLQLTGIPVFREGTFFSIPSGDWSVVEGCSGLRYLIASITLGFLYAYLSYHSPKRRLAFIILACTFPVIANGLRAYMIVMIAHLSDMKLALGVDHYIYGWVFFGLVMLLLFWIGSWWSEAEENHPPDDAGASQAEVPDRRRLFKTAVFALAAASLWPVRAAHIEDLAKARRAPVRLTAPEGRVPWTRTTELTAWEPQYIGADTKEKAFYTDGRHTVAVYLMYYRSQEQGRELINSQNILIPQKHPEWKMPLEKPAAVRLGGRTENVLQGRLQSARQNLLVWRWNWVTGVYTANDYWAKLLEAKDKFLGSIQDEAGIVVATEYDEDAQAAAQLLQDFLDAMLPSIEQSLKQAAVQ